MDPDRDARLRRLEDAVEAFLAKDPAEPAAAFLAAHDDLRELLTPMLAGEHGDADTGVGTDAAPPRRLGDFDLVRELGRGGMGIVYEATDQRLRRRVALKVMRRSPAVAPSAIVRFWREAELAASLRHPGVVPVHSLGETDDLFYLVMQLEPAASLSAVLHELQGMDPRRLDALSLPTAAASAVARLFPDATATPRPVGSHAQAVAAIAAQVAEALGHAHARGVVHRDVKPGNILVDAQGRAVLTDFGLACVLGEPGVTHTGDAPGTPNYMAPEQVRGRRGEVGPAADVFALGATIYELLLLRRAFDGDSAPSAMFAVVHREPIDPARLVPALPRDLVAIVHRALEKDPRRRYRDGAAMARDLRAFLAGEPVTARSPTRWYRLRRWAAREPLRAVMAALLAVAVPAAGIAWWTVHRQQHTAALGRQQLQREWLDAQLVAGFREAGEGDLQLARGHFARILQDLPDNDEAIAGLSVEARRRGDQPALDVLDAHAEATAASPTLRRRRAALLAALGRDDDAARLGAGLPVLATGFDAFLDGYGHIERGHRGAAGAYAEAVRALHRAVVTSERPHPLFYYEWLHAAGHAGDTAAAAEATAAVQRLWPDDASTWFWIAFAAAERRDNEEAIRLLTRAGELDPEFLGALVNRARLLREVGRNDESIAVLQAALPTAAVPAFVHRELGTSLMLAKRCAEAAQSFAIAVKAYPGEAALRRYLASALVETGKAGAAVTILEELLQLVPNDGEARFVLANALLRQNQPQQALEQLRRSLELHPMAPAAYLLGAALAQAGDATGAQQAYEQALALDPREVRAAVNLALIHLRRGDAARAEKLLRGALAVDPAFAPARRPLLRILDDRPGDAVAMCREWLQHAADSPEVQRHLAWSLVRTRDPANAPEALTLARAADAATGGRDAPTLHVLGAALLAGGDGAGAREALQRALAGIDPSDRFAGYYREQIEATLRECDAIAPAGSEGGR